ncbi:hypothetical protein MUN88_07885 [Gracilibacillus caseinilyticus]|uniref:EngC GTPase domain-containing protein n=1 Tax=Gracilibacillus caseinilyticus TaxID=2932256 RepID=A0ABY4F197_9BACI|nr:GTPase RsgA [Gracilibacillus caseinilyticus]UOQ49970.1 hypothetical protein MUN88_07885 [Gracilibacillus caseinilyticus]
MNLERLGWSDFFAEDYQQRFSNEWNVGRVIGQGKNIYKLATRLGEINGKATGKLLFETAASAQLPAVGDWVVFGYKNGDQFAVIHGVLERKSVFSRKVIGKNMEEQIIASNIDTVFLVSALNNDFNIRRIERYVTLA